MLGMWAVLTMRIQRLHIFPEVPEGSRLIVHGPYRWIRHPMYTSVLLVTFAWTMTDPRLYRLGLWMMLFGVLWVKLRYEEQLLIQQFPSYGSYQQQTHRLIPFLL